MKNIQYDSFRKNTRERTLTDVIIIVLFCLLMISFRQVSRLAKYKNNWSLRYNTPINGQAAREALLHAVDNPENGLWPTFWREDDVLLKNELSEASAYGIKYSGDGFLVWPANFIQGGWPGVTDEFGCVVSTDLAWNLWGSYDIVGKKVIIEDEIYYVRGVIEDKNNVCLISMDAATCSDGWQAIEFHNEVGLQRSDIEIFVRIGGIREPDILLNGSGFFIISLILALFPVLLLGILLLSRWISLIGNGRSFVTRIIIVALIIAIAVILPWILDLFPAWVIPAKWSDFSHWTALAGQFSGFIDSIFRLIPGMRDIILKKTLVTLIALSSFCSPLAIWLSERCR